jgi:hypothetical protein
MLLSAAEGVGLSRNGCIMTKDRARKHAARQRATLTGERYVVAQRATAQPQPHTAGRMHDLMHEMPGVPAHIEGGFQGSTSRGRSSNPRQQNRLRHNTPRVHNEPRVLVAWQNWIASRLRVHSR